MMMPSAALPRKAAALALFASIPLVAPHARAQNPAAAPAAVKPAPPTSNYWVYVGAESADLLHRIRFGPGGTVLEKSIMAGEYPSESEGPHGMQVSRDGKYL